MTDPASDHRKGLTHAAAAYLWWGLLPVYFHLVSAAPALEVLANRVFWSLGLLLLVLLVRGQLGEVAAALRTPRMLAALTASALLIGGNWFIFIRAVETHNVLAASLGYFLNPLVNVAMGVTLLGERLGRAQGFAIALAAAGVAVLAAGAATTLGISLALALTFSFYGLARKLTPVSALTGLTVETIILVPFACLALTWVDRHQGLGFGTSTALTLLLSASGILTSIPLLLFASGARRLPLVTLGLIQFMTPTIQFLLGVLAFGETMSAAQWVSFLLIWSGVAIFLGHALHRVRRTVAV